MSAAIIETSVCPDCDANISVTGDILPSEIMECSECLVELEVLSVRPLTLVTAPDVEEDWGE